MKVLIVGLGAIAKKHIEALRRIEPAVEIFALRSSKESKPEPGVTDVFSVEDIPGGIDFAIISNPTSKHAAAIDILSGYGMPLFIEKPVFESKWHEETLERVKKAGIKTYVACNLRFLDSLKWLRNYVKEHEHRKINEVNVYCGSYLPRWRKEGDYRQSYNALPELGGGVHIDLIHDIDYTCWIFGMPEASKGICRSSSTLGIKAFDYANYALIYPGFTASVVLNYYRRDYKRVIEIVFEDGTWTLNLQDNTIKDEVGSVVYEGKNSIAATYDEQMRYFIEAIKGNERIENDAEAAFEVLKICLEYEEFK